MWQLVSGPSSSQSSCASTRSSDDPAGGGGHRRIWPARAFQVAFTVPSGTAALRCSWAVASPMRIDGTFRKSVLVSLATAWTYPLRAVLLDLSGTIARPLALHLLRRS